MVRLRGGPDRLAVRRLCAHRFKAMQTCATAHPGRFS